MFGYITVNRPEMKVKDLELYRSYYCGLCAELHRRYGRKGQLVLSYDCTFLAILLSGTYEPGEKEEMCRCILHPALVHREITSRFTEYAADMNVLLAYLKAADDWRDERSQSAKMLAMLLHGPYLELREKYPRQEKSVRRNIQALHRMETQPVEGSSGSGSADGGMTEILSRIEQSAACTGKFLGELCVVSEDEWASALRATGFYLGKFVYLMDAYDDLEKDRSSGSYNVLLDLQAAVPETFDSFVQEILLDTAAHCCRAFERLPIVKDVDLLRNILYSGIWVRFNQIRSGQSDPRRMPAACDSIWK